MDCGNAATMQSAVQGIRRYLYCTAHETAQARLMSPCSRAPTPVSPITEKPCKSANCGADEPEKMERDMFYLCPISAP